MPDGLVAENAFAEFEKCWEVEAAIAAKKAEKEGETPQPKLIKVGESCNSLIFVSF